jgi:hypothetical protein
MDGREFFDTLQFHDDPAAHSQVKPLIGVWHFRLLVRFLWLFVFSCGQSFVLEKPATSDMCRLETRFFGKTWFCFETGRAGWQLSNAGRIATKSTRIHKNQLRNRVGS